MFPSRKRFEAKTLMSEANTPSNAPTPLPEWNALTIIDTPLSAPCIFDELCDNSYSSGALAETSNDDKSCEKQRREIELQKTERKLVEELQEVHENCAQEQANEEKDAEENEEMKKIPTVKERLQMLRRSAGGQWLEPEVAEPHDVVIEDVLYGNPNESYSWNSDTAYRTAERFEGKFYESKPRPRATWHETKANDAHEMEDGPILTCFACEHDYPRREFTKSQLKKGRKRRCPQCVGVEVQGHCIVA